VTPAHPRTPAPAAVDELVELVLAVPGVAKLHPGRFGEVATYLPGRRVTGIRSGRDAVEVHLVLAAGHPVQAVAQQVHAVVAARVDLPVQVHVEDVLDVAAPPG